MLIGGETNFQGGSLGSVGYLIVNEQHIPDSIRLCTIYMIGSYYMFDTVCMYVYGRVKSENER